MFSARKARPVRRIAVAGAVACAALLGCRRTAGEPAPKPVEAAPAHIRTLIVVRGAPFPCLITAHDERTVTVYLVETRKLRRFKWKKLDPGERERLRFMIEMRELERRGRPVGEAIPGVRVKLRTGMTCRGVELVKGRTPSHRYFRFAGVPLMGVPRREVRSVRPIRMWEGDLYTPREVYRARLAARPPKNAADHFKLGQWCLQNEMLEEAGDHFAKSQLLDDGFVERCKDQKPLLRQLAKRQVARQFHARLLRDQAAGRWGRALHTLDLLEREYPYYWRDNKPTTPLREELERERAAMPRKEVVGFFYMYMDHFVQKCAYDRVSDTPAVPIKVIYLTSGYIVQGTLVGSADGDVVTIKSAGLTYKIKREHIAKIEQKLVQRGPFRNRTLAECRKYLTDRKGGVSADILIAVAVDVLLTQPEVRRIWNARLAPAGLGRPAPAAAFREARWGAGSWLRDYYAAEAAGRKKRPGWPDPEKWWKQQKREVKAEILRAMCAEALMKVEKVYKEPCVNCGGTGRIEMARKGSGAYPCSVCRGSGTLYGVIYR